MTRVLAVLCLAAAMARPMAAQDTPQPAPLLSAFRLEGSTVYNQDDVLWLLRLREGAPLPGDAAGVAKALQDRYERDGYAEARVSGTFAGGRLTLRVDEGRIDEVEILGASGAEAERLRVLLDIKPGDIYNTRVIGRATARLTEGSRGAIAIGRPRPRQPDADRAESVRGAVTLDRRGTRNVLVVPLRWNTSRTNTTVGSGREDLFSPVDGLSPAIAVSSIIFDHSAFNHTFVHGYVSYKFGRDDPGYSLGAERPLFRGPARLVVGAETHDVTTSDDLWRLSSVEQALVAVTFKNSFRDYYRRKGSQAFAVLRAGEHSEISLTGRWDRHEPLPNATSYSFFRDSAVFRPSLPVQDRRVNALIVGYTFDTRPLTGPGQRATYERHLKDSLFGFGVRQRPGVRVEWTSEIAGHALKGDAGFERHILNARGHVPLSRRTTLSLRGIFGLSNGTLPVERLFAIGGIGSVHGYAFKEASGTGMALLNAEYRVDLTPSRGNEGRDTLSVFGFYDAGTVSPAEGAARAWLRGVGFGAGAGPVRVEIGFRANDIPRSRQILVRFSPTF